MTSSLRQTCNALRDADGYPPLADDGALGEGRAVALSDVEGSIGNLPQAPTHPAIIQAIATLTGNEL